MSSFGLIEENVELSHVHLAVHKLGLAVTTYILNSSIDLIIHKNPKVDDLFATYLTKSTSIKSTRKQLVLTSASKPQKKARD